MAHRKIDVDIIDEDNYLEDDELGLDQQLLQRSPQEAEAEVAARANDARSAFNRGDAAAALQTALSKPYFSKDHDNAKARNLQAVIDLLQSIKTADVPNVVKTLSIDEQDVLMKFLYRAMASPELFNSGILLSWHEKLTEITGLGAIVRVMTDRRRV